MNVTILTVGELASILHARISGNRSQAVIVSLRRFSQPSRGQLAFVRGINNNESALLRDMMNRGILCIVAAPGQRITPQIWNRAGIAILSVENVRTAYMRLAQYNRDGYNIPFVQVIGSSGKTSTKEMIGSVLREKSTPLMTQESMNGPMDIAYRLHRLNDEHQAAVLEVGMNAPGTMRISSRMIKPNIVVLTSIQRSHLPRLGSIENIIKAKAEVMEFLNKDGTLIINGEDKNCARFPISGFQGKVLRYGLSSRHDIWASDIQSDGFQTHFKAQGKNLQMDCLINTFGTYNVGNALAAILVGRKLGLTQAEIARGLAKYQPPEGRLKPHRARNRAIIINDNVNANPDSTKLLLEELKLLAKEHLVILVLGDMESASNDIAEYARKVHYEIGCQLAGIGLFHVLAIGKWAKEYIRGAVAAGYPEHKIEYFLSVPAARERFVQLATPDTIVVLKSSSVIRLDQLMENIV